MWRWVLVGLLCTAFVSRIGAVELGRRQPTERISGQSSFYYFASNFVLNLFFFILSVLGYMWSFCIDLKYFNCDVD